jgi:hypothetical protein
MTGSGLFLVATVSRLVFGSAPAQVTLRWKVAPNQTVMFKVERRADPQHRLMDMSPPPPNGKRTEPPMLRPLESEQLIMVTRAEVGTNLKVRMLLTSLDPGPHQPHPEEMTKAVGQEELDTTMNEFGFLSPEIDDSRGDMAVLFELPNQPVSVGDHWSISATPEHWGQESSPRVNRFVLTRLDKTPDGKTVAVINFELSESRAGSFVHKGDTTEVPTKLHSLVKGQGEFLVEDGCWKHMSFHTSEKITGRSEVDLEEQTEVVQPNEVPSFEHGKKQP